LADTGCLMRKVHYDLNARIKTLVANLENTEKSAKALTCAPARRFLFERAIGIETETESEVETRRGRLLRTAAR
jgi:hypothetical protein